MAHELDITNGVASFADSRTDAWHQLGQQIGHVMTADQALREAQLAGWNVRKHALYTSDDEGFPIPVPDRFATVRTNPVSKGVDYLGVVGSTYRVIQNEELATFLDALVDESGAHYETAGALRGGREVFVTMKLPEHLTFQLPGGGTDTTELYIAALNRHDGGGAMRVLVTPVRIVCANTQGAALASAKSSWSVRHVGTALEAIEQARQALTLSFTYADAFSQNIQAMIDAQIEEDEARRLLSQVFRVDEADSPRARDLRIGHVNATLAGLELPTCQGIAGTRYGVYNAVTEYIDHRVPRGDKRGVAPARQLFGGSFELKTRAFDLLTVGS